MFFCGGGDRHSAAGLRQGQALDASRKLALRAPGIPPPDHGKGRKLALRAPGVPPPDYGKDRKLALRAPGVPPPDHGKGKPLTRAENLHCVRRFLP